MTTSHIVTHFHSAQPQAGPSQYIEISLPLSLCPPTKTKTKTKTKIKTNTEFSIIEFSLFLSKLTQIQVNSSKFKKIQVN